jgi:hypothetical protein
MNPNSFEILATVLFAVAVLHTFLCGRLTALASRYPEGSFAENAYHLIGEVEVVFGFWAGVFLASVALFPAVGGAGRSLEYLEGLNLTEPAFVFVVMAIAATRPVMQLAESAIHRLAQWLPLPPRTAQVAVTLSVGPLLGSFITEPAAMTVCALLLHKSLFQHTTSERLRYAALAALFVNVSVGGVLTNFAAPPVLMVAGPWKWDLAFMLTHFGPRAVIAVLLNTVGLLWFFRKDLAALEGSPEAPRKASVPVGLGLIHLALLGAVVASSHHPRVFGGFFLLFLGVVQVTREYQDELRLREALLVSFFLAGLVVLGQPQQWWLLSVVQDLGQGTLFLGAAALTAVLDNAALTYLGTQVPSLSEAARYFLVAGAVSGGGLTVIANAPNPIGFSILQPTFANGAVSPVRLLRVALAPTAVAIACMGLAA